MKQENKSQKKSKKHQKSKRKIGLLDRMNLWFVQHSTIAWILDASVLLFSTLGILCLLYGTTLIPSSYRELHYSFPLFMNLAFLVNILYQGIFRDNFDGMTRLQDFTNPFLYLNGVGLLFHSFFGIMGRNRKSIPPLLSLDHRYIWFPILTYITFFLVAALIILISKHIEKKKGKKENRENSLK